MSSLLFWVIVLLALAAGAYAVYTYGWKGAVAAVTGFAAAAWAWFADLFSGIGGAVP